MTRRILLGGTAGAGLMTAFPLKDAALAADLGAVAGLAGPKVHTRGQWKAKAPRRKAAVLDRAPDRIIVHHTATPNVTDYSVAHAYRLSRSIQRFHMHTRRWDDIGEQLTISRGGVVMEGRNRSLAAIQAGRHVVGAQTLNHNRHTIGIENEGTYLKVAVPARLWASLVETCTWLCAVYRLNPYAAIVGHRDLGSTDCPGDVLYRRLPELRRAVAARLDVPKPRVAAPPKPSGARPMGTASPDPSASPSVPADEPTIVFLDGPSPFLRE